MPRPGTLLRNDVNSGGVSPTLTLDPSPEMKSWSGGQTPPETTDTLLLLVLPQVLPAWTQYAPPAAVPGPMMAMDGKLKYSSDAKTVARICSSVKVASPAAYVESSGPLAVRRR